MDHCLRRKRSVLRLHHLLHLLWSHQLLSVDTPLHVLLLLMQVLLLLLGCLLGSNLLLEGLNIYTSSCCWLLAILLVGATREVQMHLESSFQKEGQVTAIYMDMVLRVIIVLVIDLRLMMLLSSLLLLLLLFRNILALVLDDADDILIHLPLQTGLVANLFALFEVL
mmetsp:Transcript_21907/g.34035  ORF Transcript_21907/g.34035 Transcript_21907/m.34035 type:complete len:167 (+) Transcript_21907:470-970(+)